MIDRRNLIVGGSLAMIALPTLAMAHDVKTHEVFMHNVHPNNSNVRMVFTPRILKVAKGEMVSFIPNDPGHNCQSTKGMIPEGADPWRGSFGKELSVSFDIPGIYGYHCLPHRSMGMVGLVIVEGPEMLDNLEAAQSIKHPGRAKLVWDEIWAEVAEKETLEL